ncbi:MAG: TrkA family potassium uptake protein [Clostridiaceae bacterium]|nr:TrkA family potassium uptake protein [Clostridiaceae bacterium]
MRIVIVGGGKLAYYLIKTLRPYKHQISVIETLKDVSERIATDFDEVNVYQGDGTTIRIMEESGCHNADFYIAVTGKDENNLIGCEIAKKRFHVRNTVARVNNPKNAEMFTRLGVDKVYSSTQILADIIEQDIDYEGMRSVFSIDKTTKSIIEFVLSPKSAACDKTLAEYDFPGRSKLVLLTRPNGFVEMPAGDLVMKADDIILLICDEKDYDNIWKTMVRR